MEIYNALLICMAIFYHKSAAHELSCLFEYTTFVWGDHIDFMEWSCNVKDIEMKSSSFNVTFDNVTSMHIIRTTNTSLPIKLYQKFPNLTNLRVEFADIFSLTQHDTEGMHNLRNLYLGNDNISNISEGAFENFPLLKLLYLNGNNLTRLPNSTFHKLTNLERLWLNDNHLTDLHAELLSHNKNLNRVFLQNNKLLVIGEESFNIPNLQIVDLRGNICINKWTFDTPLSEVKKFAAANCNPSVENMRKSTIVMAKIIHELSVRDIALHEQLAMKDMKILELEERLKAYEVENY